MNFWQKIKTFFGVSGVNQHQEALTYRSGRTESVKSIDNLAAEDASARKNRPVEYRDRVKPKTGKVSIAYDADLIDQLQDEHRSLLRSFMRINFLVSDNQFENGLNVLLKFRSKLLNHLHLENLKLYVYLQHTLSDRPEAYAQMRNFRKEMSATEKVVLDFFVRYEKAGISFDNKGDFLSDWSMIGDALSQRIQQEESRLYTMYQEKA